MGIQRKELFNSVFALRWLVFLIGLLIMAFGIALMIKANIGSAPWDVLHVGLYYQFGLTIGTWSIIIGFFIIGLTTLLTKQRPLFGAFLNMLLVGVFIDFYLLLPILKTPSSFMGKLVMLLIGIIVIGYGIGLYIAANCGAGPRDSLMLALTEKVGLKVQWVRGIMELVVLFFGWLLGGPVSIGTLIFSFSIGSIVGFTLPQCRTFVNGIFERGVADENINKRPLWLNNHDGISKKAR
ncbi:YczE/YyaS/YitT family protein [Bacillus taeanensis]|uniref:YitT family protein n=1 Tax=Bacillus taeanensis TaxID=273032 RepID=A0A366Y072_9BACI|nr:YitT family protein [Bacillus taeanensis]RBW70439.1 YitT family protein [Bacillus taeanensis]